MVVELPSEERARAKPLARVARLAKAMAFDGDRDDGQAYAFVMLD